MQRFAAFLRCIKIRQHFNIIPVMSVVLKLFSLIQFSVDPVAYPNSY